MYNVYVSPGSRSPAKYISWLLLTQIQAAAGYLTFLHPSLSWIPEEAVLLKGQYHLLTPSSRLDTTEKSAIKGTASPTHIILSAGDRGY